MKHARLTEPAAQISEVVYNAMSQSFDAMVTLYDLGVASRYAVSVPGPMSMEFDRASAALLQQAHKQHAADNGLRSRIVPAHPREPAPTIARIVTRFSHSGFLRRRVS